MRKPLWAALAVALFLSVPLALLFVPPTPRVPPRCQVTAQAIATETPGIYRVAFVTVPSCPPNGYARVRMESGRIYPWRIVRPGEVTFSRGVPWYWGAVWEATSGRTYPIPIQGLRAPWRHP